MNSKLIAILLILLISASVGFLLFVWQPEISQMQMHEYNNTNLPQRTGFIQPVLCPISNSSGDNITPVGMVEEHLASTDVVGSRINVIGLFYCQDHHIWFSVS